MKDSNSALSFFETLPNRLDEAGVCLRQAGPLDFLAEQPAAGLAGNYEHRLPKEKPKLLDSGKPQNK
jgi:hypothetical protein